MTKPEIAIEEIDRVIASGVRFGCVLADSGYGSSGPFRQALSERGLKWAGGLSRRQNVYPADIALVFPVATTGRRRKYHIPDRPPVSAEAMLADEKWRKVSWRQGTKGRLSCRFATCRVRLADALGNLVRFKLLPGQRSEITAVHGLIDGLAFEAMLADKAFDADHLRDRLNKQGAEAVIPAKRNRAVHIPHDAQIYQWRHLIENYFSKIKEFRGVNTRYDKTDASYEATWFLAATIIALR